MSSVLLMQTKPSFMYWNFSNAIHILFPLLACLWKCITNITHPGRQKWIKEVLQNKQRKQVSRTLTFVIGHIMPPYVTTASPSTRYTHLTWKILPVTAFLHSSIFDKSILNCRSWSLVIPNTVEKPVIKAYLFQFKMSFYPKGAFGDFCF